jgi:23S rRNA (guanosine2251-2'-O)-methyltransferase
MYIYGKNVVREKLNSGDKIKRAIISDRFRDKDIVNGLREKNIKISFVPEKELDRKVEGLHQGIVLEIDDVKTYELEEIIDKIDKEYPTLVMLDHLEDPHNFGAIIRTCEALGVDGIIIPNDRSVSINSTVVKTSVGAIEYIPIIRVVNLVNTIKKLKDKGYWIVGTDMGSTDYTTIDYKMPVCLIIGNEGKGISKLVRDNCDFIATIPMVGKINSLNASVSLGIVLSEIVSKR